MAYPKRLDPDPTFPFDWDPKLLLLFKFLMTTSESKCHSKNSNTFLIFPHFSFIVQNTVPVPRVSTLTVFACKFEISIYRLGQLNS